MLDREQLAPHQPRWRLVGNANAQVNVVIDQIDITILEDQLHINLGVTAQKLGHMGMYHIPPHGLGHAQANEPLGLPGKTPAQVHHRLSRTGHFIATFENLFTCIGQAELAGCALQ